MSVDITIIFYAKIGRNAAKFHLKKVLEYSKKLKDCIRQTNDILFPMSVMFANDFSALSKMLAFARVIKGSWRRTSAPMNPRAL